MQTTYLMLQNLAANGTADLMVNADTGESDARFIGMNSIVSLAINADAVGIELQVSLSGRVVVPRSTLPAGGTLGVFPNVADFAFEFAAAAGEILKVELREIAAVATTDIMGTITVAPL